MNRIAVLVGRHGRGSNLKALRDACQDDHPGRVVRVIAPTSETPALAHAQDIGLVVPVSPVDSYGQRLVEALKGIDWVCLSGYLRLLPGEVLQQFPNHVVNIHPALLPKFGGKGMYGIHVHQAVIAAREAESGCTIHLVNEHYDEGEIVHQMVCKLDPGETPESLAAKVLQLEHVAYAAALRKLMSP